MDNGEWSPARVAAALAGLEDAGHSQPRMARAADVSQSTVNRWRRGKVQPGYAAVRRLAVTVYRRHPELARELVEAAGYPWSEPQDAPEPDPIPADVLRVINKAVSSGERSQEWADEAIAALTAIGSEPREGAQRDAGLARPGQPGKESRGPGSGTAPRSPGQQG